MMAVHHMSYMRAVRVTTAPNYLPTCRSATPASERLRSDMAATAQVSDVLITIGGDGVLHTAGGGMEPVSPRGMDPAPRPIDDTERLLSLQIAIKASSF
jgi:hypothetical protein